MKIVMPVGEYKGLDSEMFGHFGSAPFFVVYDTDSQDVKMIANSGAEHEHGSCMPVQMLGGIDADAVLCRGMGMGAANKLLAAGISPYITDADTVKDAVDAFKAGRIRKLDAGNACHHHGCH